MKIYNINNNPTGQSTMKGNVFHFAQQVEEIHEHLPLTMSQTNNIIVNGTLSGSGVTSLLAPYALTSAISSGLSST